MNAGKKRRSSVELSAHKRFEKSRSRWKGYPAKPWLCGERTSDEVTEPCCLRRGEGYAIREDESIVPEHTFCVLRGLGQCPNKHETGRFRVNGIRLFSQSGYRFALLAVLCKPRKWRKKRRYTLFLRILRFFSRFHRLDRGFYNF